MKKLILFLFALCLSVSTFAQTGDYFVDATNGNDTYAGTSWAAAKKTFSFIGTMSAPGSYKNVFVAQGTYLAQFTGTDRRFNLYGGFPTGGGDGTFAARNWRTYPTILDGNYPTNPTVSALSFSSNCIVFDGFIVQNCYTASGGVASGIQMSSPKGVISNCIIRGCASNGNNSNGNAAVKLTGTAGVVGPPSVYSPSIKNCEIYANYTVTTGRSYPGSAVHILDGGTVQNCKIYNNSQLYSNPSTSSSPTNGPNGGSGVIYIQNSSATQKLKSNVYVVDNVIYNNSAATGNGIFINLSQTNAATDSTIYIVNNTFANNKALSGTDGFLKVTLAQITGVDNTSPARINVNNNIFWGNVDNATATVPTASIAKTTFTNNTVQGDITGLHVSNKSLSATNATDIKFTTPSGSAGCSLTKANYAGNQTATETLAGADWSIGSTSTAKEAGINAALTAYSWWGNSATTDYAGNARIVGTIDMGAYESQESAYFRSKASGNWATIGTWESSSNNSIWTDATLIPTSSATTINVLLGHEVTVAAAATSSTLTVNAGGKLTLNSGITLSATNLTLKSTVIDGTATFKDLGGTLTVTGTTNVEQYFGTAQYGGAERNWYISSPLASASSSLFTSAGTLWKYNEPNTGTTGSPINTNWDLISTPETMTGGYIFRPTAASPTITLTGGALNTGSKTVNLYRTTANTNTANIGYNLIGNPYPSYLNAMTAINNNSSLLSAAIWYRTLASDKSKYYFETVVTTTGVGTNNAGTGKVTGYIPPMQAFWVKTSAATTLTFDNTMRAHAFNVPVGEVTVPTTPLKVSSAKSSTIQQLLRLQVSNGASNDETIVYFHPNASNNYDNYDAPKRSNGNVNIPEIYTFANSEKLVINGMNELKLETEIPVVFSTGRANNFTIKATELSNFQDMKIILIDKQNPITKFDLTDGAAYSFSSDVTNDAMRFSILFRAPSSPNAVNTVEKLNAQVFVNAANQITIVAPEKSNYAIYNAVGMLLENGQTTAKLQTANSKLQTGVYLVKVSDNGRNYTSRVIIK
jgi:hypothetical protein